MQVCLLMPAVDLWRHLQDDWEINMDSSCSAEEVFVLLRGILTNSAELCLSLTGAVGHVRQQWASCLPYVNQTCCTTSDSTALTCVRKDSNSLSLKVLKASLKKKMLPHEVEIKFYRIKQLSVKGQHVWFRCSLCMKTKD